MNVYQRAIRLGFIAGLRSMAAPAMMSRYAIRHPDGFEGTAFEWMSSHAVAGGFTLAMAGELLLDKLPILPDRIDAGPLVGRMVFGGLAGAAVFAEAKQPLALGAALGAAGAVLGAHAGYRFRVGVSRKLGVPDLPLALIEDAFVMAVGSYLTRH